MEQQHFTWDRFFSAAFMGGFVFMVLWTIWCMLTLDIWESDLRQDRAQLLQQGVRIEEASARLEAQTGEILHWVEQQSPETQRAFTSAMEQAKIRSRLNRIEEQLN